MMNLRPWPFREPRDHKVLTTIPILAGKLPILCIVHESGREGCWRFLNLKSELEDVCLATFEDVVDYDSEAWKVAAGLPVRCKAQRASINDPWIREYWSKSSSKKGATGRRSKTRPRGKSSP